VTTPRVTRLVRAPDLRALQRAIVALLPAGIEARRTAVVLPTRSAAEAMRRTIEDSDPDDRGGPVVLLPDLVTRQELYLRLHARIPDAPALLSEFDREVLLRLAAGEARAQGAEPPFRLRPGLIAALLDFYDELRRRNRSVDAFDRTIGDRLEGGSDSDRGAARLLQQTRFLSAAFAAFERRVADSGHIDEHGLRSLLLADALPSGYDHVVVCVGDRAADPRGLWPADFDLLSRLPGLRRLDVVATDRVLDAGLLERLHDALPGLEESRANAAGPLPVLLAPEVRPAEGPQCHFVSRDREEELADAVRWIKAATPPVPARSLDRVAVVFQRPLPYLYLARQVFGSSRVPYQAMDALPLAAEPFAAAVDLIFVAVLDEGTRSALVELLGSAQWRFSDPLDGERPIQRQHVAALDRVLQEARFLGGWDRLSALAATIDARAAGAGREAARWRRAAAALRAAAGLGAELAAIRTALAASGQIDALLSFVRSHERLPPSSDPSQERHLRARGAVLGALTSLRDAHVRYDDSPLPAAELVATLRRWIEGQTFSPRRGEDGGVLLVDAPAAAFADVDAVRIVGLVDPDWPERGSGTIFYPATLLRDLGWGPDAESRSAARARFHDLLLLPRHQVSLSSFTLEDDSIVAPSSFLDDVPAAGLGVTRRPEAPPTRIFEHEALAIEPVSPGVLPAEAAGWLQIRMSRSSAREARYRGSVGPRPPGIYAVSRVERYLECPFKYFAGHVLQLEEERDDESGLTPLERGQLLHGVFEAFFVEWQRPGRTTITNENLDEAIALFAKVADGQLQALPEADRALERTYLLGSAASPGLAERAFVFEIEQGVPVIERLLEHTLEGRFRLEGPGGAREVELRGKADRIDLLQDGTFRVIDYKLGKAPKPARALQLAIYGVAAQQQLEGHRGRSWSLGRAGYVAFREKNPFVELGGRAGNLEAALRDGQGRLLGAVDAMEAGEFPVSPDEPFMCTRCGFPHLCRKDYVGDE
jgi:RecB family exonuclease